MKFLLILMLSASSLSKLVGQDTVKTRLIIFDDEELTTPKAKKEKIKDVDFRKNALKINPLLYLRGELPIYYERALTQNLSIEAAVGMTFKDYSAGFANSFDESSNNYNSERAKEKVIPNTSFKLGLRYYSGDVVLDGFYFAIEYAKRDYTKEVTITDEIVTNTVGFSNTFATVVYNFKEEEFHNEIKLIVGSQEHYYWDNVFIDYYLGAGIDKYSEKKIEVTYNSTTSQNDYVLNSKSETVPRFYLGLKIGFVF